MDWDVTEHSTPLGVTAAVVVVYFTISHTDCIVLTHRGVKKAVTGVGVWKEKTNIIQAAIVSDRYNVSPGVVLTRGRMVSGRAMRCVGSC